METGDGGYRLVDPDLVSPLNPGYRLLIVRKLCREFSLREVNPVSRVEKILHARDMVCICGRGKLAGD